MLLFCWKNGRRRKISRDTFLKTVSGGSRMDLLSEPPELSFNTVPHSAGMDLIEIVLKVDA